MVIREQIAGVVVFYNPNTKESIKNIKSYIDSLGMLYVVDNSEGVIDDELQIFISNNDRIKYITLGQNMGIATALNCGARNAMNDGYEWILTMDQDSQSPKDMVQKLYEFVLSARVDKLAIVAAIPSTSLVSTSQSDLPKWQVTATAYTSGNIVRLKAWLEVGGWCDELFIDLVDTTFNFELQLRGWKIVHLNDVVLKHVLGNSRMISIMGRKLMIITNHNYIRRYYITRNRLYFCQNKAYAMYCIEHVKMEKRAFIKDIIKILFFETDKLRKFGSIHRACQDFRQGIKGKLHK